MKPRATYLHNTHQQKYKQYRRLTFKKIFCTSIVSYKILNNMKTTNIHRY